MRRFTFLLVTVLLAFATNSWSQVFITELADPNNAAGARFVELYNAGATDVDFSTGWQLQRATNGNTYWASPVNLTGTIPAGGFYIVCANQTTFTSTFGFAADQSIGTGGPADSNGDDQIRLLSPGTVVEDMFGVLGEDGSGTNHEFEDGRAERKATVTAGNATYTFAEWNIWNDTGGAGTTNDPQDAPADFDPGAWIGASASPVLTVSPLVLSGLNYELGNGPSASQMFTVEGSNLTNDMLVTPSTNYEISLDDMTYQLTAITLTQSGGSVTNTTIYTRLQAGLSVGDYVEDVVVSSTGAADKNVTCSGTVEAPAMTILPYAEPFDLDLGDCYVYSVSGSLSTWEYGNYGGNGYADVNGYGTGDVEEDWIILPGINFDSYSNERMTFDLWYQYGADDVDNYLKLYWSSDYYGIGDPSGATWTEISYTAPSASNSWEPSGTLDISGITGTNVYLAFKYNYQPGSYRWWQLDNLSIYEASYVNVTFQVNMEEQFVSGDGVHIAGSFQGWDPAGTLMYDDGTNGDLTVGDGIYSVTVALVQGLEYEFKYLNGMAWGTDEGVPSECQKPGTSNRYEVVGSVDYALDVVCFGSCNDCGTPHWDVTFRVDMRNETVTGDVYIAGDFNGWSDVAMTNTEGSVYEITYNLEEGSYQEYKFKNGPGGWEGFNGTCVVWDGGNRFMTAPFEDTVLDLVCFNSCDACPVADFVMINEVDADTPGTDDAEFIELYDGGVGNTSLTGLVVVLYNGSDDASYSPAIDLDGYFTNAEGYFVIGSTGMGTDIEISPGGSGWLQNGPDAVALHIGDDTDYPTDTPVSDVNLIDALVYDTNDADDSGLIDVLTPGQPQINEDGRGDKDYQSNQRIPNGSGGFRMTYTYDQSPTTMGVENVGIYTDWIGTIDADWNNAGNWSNGVPTDMLNAEIPDVSGVKAPFPIISGAATCLSLYMAPNSTLWIDPDGFMTVIGTFINAGGNLTIKSDATGTGSLIENNGVNATVERYLSQDKWHYVSSPVDDPNTSVFTGLYMMWWDEPSEYWKWVFSADSTLAVDMQGYALWSEGSITGNATVVFDGALNAGAKTINTTNVAGTPHAIDYSGFNFVGNPYPSGVDWNNNDGNGWTRTNLDNAIWIWNQDAGNYGTYVKDAPSGTNGVDNEIPQNQAFYVMCNNVAGGSLSVDDLARTHVTGDILKGSKTDKQYVKFKVEGNNYSDEMMINVQKGSTIIFDNQFDALKFRGLEDAPQFYSLSKDSKELSMNTIPAIKKGLTIPAGIEVGIEGDYLLTIDEISAFDNTPVFVEDLKTGKIINMKNVSSYSFYATPSDDAVRFLLHFSNSESPSYNEIASYKSVNIYSMGSTIVLSSKDEMTGVIKVHDLMGREVYNETISESFQHEISSFAPKGYYILSFISDSEVYTEKVFVK